MSSYISDVKNKYASSGLVDVKVSSHHIQRHVHPTEVELINRPASARDPAVTHSAVIEDPLECMVNFFINIFEIFRVDNGHVKMFLDVKIPFQHYEENRVVQYKIYVGCCIIQQ